MTTDTGRSTPSSGDEPRSTQLRILLVNQHYLPSKAPTARLLADVGSALAAEGHDVVAVSSRRGYHDASIRFPKTEDIDGVRVERVPGTRFDQSRRIGRIGNYLTFFASAGARLFTIRKPDVVVCLSTPPLFASIVQIFAALRRVRIVYWVMDVHPELAFRLGQVRPNSLTGKLLSRAAKLPLGRADAVIVLGDDMARHIHPDSNGNTRVVPNWADGERIRPATSVKHALRTKWGWDGKFIVAYSGTMGLVHEFDTILEAATQLNDDERYLFCFIGGGPRSKDVKAEVERRGLRNVEFRDYVPEEQLPQSLTAPDLHLVSLRNDLAGLSVPSKTYSILAAGKPVAYVGPHHSEIASLIDRSGCGVHIENGDSNGLVQAITTYVESPDVLTTHEKAARKTFETDYSRDHGLRAIVSLIAG